MRGNKKQNSFNSVQNSAQCFWPKNMDFGDKKCYKAGIHIVLWKNCEFEWKKFKILRCCQSWVLFSRSPDSVCTVMGFFKNRAKDEDDSFLVCTV